VASPNATNGETIGQRLVAWFHEHRRQAGRAAAVALVSLLILAAGSRLIGAWLASLREDGRVGLERVTATGETHEPRGSRTRAATESTLPGTKSTAKSATPNATNGPTRRTESVSPPPAASDASVEEHDAALRELARFRQQLHPDSTVPAATARAAIQRLEALMPQFRDRTDSLFAMLYQAHAYYHLGELENECAMLRRIRSRATGTRLEDVVKGYFGDGRCPD
jgi:hypothetical protein